MEPLAILTLLIEVAFSAARLLTQPLKRLDYAGRHLQIGQLALFDASNSTFWTVSALAPSLPRERHDPVHTVVPSSIAGAML